MILLLQFLRLQYPVNIILMTPRNLLLKKFPSPNNNGIEIYHGSMILNLAQNETVQLNLWKMVVDTLVYP